MEPNGGTFRTDLIRFAQNIVRSFDIGPNATRVGVVHFSTGTPTPDFLLNRYSNADDIVAAIQTIPYDGLGTQTSLGIQVVMSQLFNEANGMRPVSAGVSRVLIVVTDGQANTGFNPIPATNALKSTLNVNVFSIGVGCAYDINQLYGMASPPISTHVFLLRSFNIINLILSQLNSAACAAAAVVTPGQNTVASVDSCDIKYYRPQCGAFTSTIIIQVQDLVGATNVFVSTVTENPGPYNFSVVSTTTPFKTIVFRQNGTILPVYIGVQGVGAVNSFTINIFSGLVYFKVCLL
jgi:hypothetical protein